MQSDTAEITRLLHQLLSTHIDFDTAYYELADDPSENLQNWSLSQINSPSSFLFVAENLELNPIPDQQTTPSLLGMVSGYEKYLFPWFKLKSVGHISFLIVDCKFRREGIGNNLEKAAARWCAERQLNYIELYTDEPNIPAVNFWKKTGYHPFKKFLRKKIS